MICLKKTGAVARVSVLELFRRRDVYVALILALVVIVPLSGVNLFGVEGVVQYLRELTLLLIWVFGIAITVTNAARQVPGEVERRTILPLLAKPIRRSEFVVGKFLGTAAAAGASITIFYACFVVLTGIKSGIWFTPTLVQAYVFHLIFVALLSALTVCGSMVLTPSANMTLAVLISGGMVLFGQRLSALAADLAPPVSWLAWAVHFVFPHFEFFDARHRVVHSWEPNTLPVASGVVLYGLLYTLALLFLAVVLFRRKKL